MIHLKIKSTLNSYLLSYNFFLPKIKAHLQNQVVINVHVADTDAN